MFAVVKFLPSPTGFMRFKSLFFKLPVKITGKIALGIPYLELSLPQNRRRFSLCEKDVFDESPVDCVIIDKTISNERLCDISLPFKVSDSSEFYSRLLVNYVREEIRRVSKERNVSVILFDPDSQCTGVCVELLRLCDVTVVTKRSERYIPCCAYSIREIGAVPNVKLPDEQLPACDYLIAPYGLGKYPPVCTAGAIFSPECRRGALHPDKSKIGFPLPLLNDCPDYIDPFELAAALYNDGSVPALGEIIPTVITSAAQ